MSLIRMLDGFKERGIAFRSLTEAIQHRDPHRPRHVADDRRADRA